MLKLHDLFKNKLKNPQYFHKSYAAELGLSPNPIHLCAIHLNDKLNWV